MPHKPGHSPVSLPAIPLAGTEPGGVRAFPRGLPGGRPNLAAKGMAGVKGGITLQPRDVLRSTGIKSILQAIDDIIAGKNPESARRILYDGLRRLAGGRVTPKATAIAGGPAALGAGVAALGETALGPVGGAPSQVLQQMEQVLINERQAPAKAAGRVGKGITRGSDARMKSLIKNLTRMARGEGTAFQQTTRPFTKAGRAAGLAQQTTARRATAAVAARGADVAKMKPTGLAKAAAFGRRHPGLLTGVLPIAASMMFSSVQEEKAANLQKMRELEARKAAASDPDAMMQELLFQEAMAGRQARQPMPEAGLAPGEIGLSIPMGGGGSAVGNELMLEELLRRLGG